MSWLTVQLRRLADSRAATGGLIGLALVTSFLFAIAPRVIDTQADVALRSTVDAATSGTRNIAVSQTGRIAAASPDPLAAISTDGDQFFEQFPGSAAALVQARYTTIDTARFLPLGLEGRTVRLRYLQGATDHISLVSGGGVCRPGRRPSCRSRPDRSRAGRHCYPGRSHCRNR